MQGEWMRCMVWNWSCCLCMVPRMLACLGQWRTVPHVYGLEMGTQKILGLLDWSFWWRNWSNPKGLACWLFTIEHRVGVIAYCWINEAGFLVWRYIKNTVWANSVGAVLVREQFSDHNIRMRGLWWKFFSCSINIHTRTKGRLGHLFWGRLCRGRFYHFPGGLRLWVTWHGWLKSTTHIPLGLYSLWASSASQTVWLWVMFWEPMTQIWQEVAELEVRNLEE